METKNFKFYELACSCGCNSLPKTKEVKYAIELLQKLRDVWGKPLILNCGHRCKTHNKAVGGKENSRHLKIAFDISTAGWSLEKKKNFIDMALTVDNKPGFRGFGFYNTFIHIDTGFELKNYRHWVLGKSNDCLQCVCYFIEKINKK